MQGGAPTLAWAELQQSGGLDPLSSDSASGGAVTSFHLSVRVDRGSFKVTSSPGAPPASCSHGLAGAQPLLGSSAQPGDGGGGATSICSNGRGWSLPRWRLGASTQQAESRSLSALWNGRGSRSSQALVHIFRFRFFWPGLDERLRLKRSGGLATGGV